MRRQGRNNKNAVSRENKLKNTKNTKNTRNKREQPANVEEIKESNIEDNEAVLVNAGIDPKLIETFVGILVKKEFDNNQNIKTLNETVSKLNGQAELNQSPSRDGEVQCARDRS